MLVLPSPTGQPHTGGEDRTPRHCLHICTDHMDGRCPGITAENISQAYRVSVKELKPAGGTRMMAFHSSSRQDSRTCDVGHTRVEKGGEPADKFHLASQGAWAYSPCRSSLMNNGQMWTKGHVLECSQRPRTGNNPDAPSTGERANTSGVQPHNGI